MACNYKKYNKDLQLFKVSVVTEVLFCFYNDNNVLIIKYLLLDFKEWKSKLEDDDLCYYVITARKTSYNKKVMYLDCHRTGNFQSRSTGVRKIKSQGTNKIGSTCPSSMVWVFFLLNHINLCFTC